MSASTLAAPATHGSAALPSARGPVSRALHALLAGERAGTAEVTRAVLALGEVDADPRAVLADEDVQLALWMLYELHYRGFGPTGEALEWDADLLVARAGLEARLETALRALAPVPDDVGPDHVAQALFTMTAESPGPSLSKFVARRASLEQLRELVVHRSVYHLKEADPHTWAIPRLAGSVKAAMVEIQTDEYGGGRAERAHAALFARTVRALGLDDTYGRYVDAVPAATLATSNTMSMFGLNRRLLGAVVGHLAAFEMTSSLPNRRYGQGARRLGLDADATWFFDEHVEADAVHEQIAAHDLAAGFARQHPERTAEVLFGAAAGQVVDDVVAAHQLACWQSGRSSLRGEVDVAALVSA